MIKKIVRSYQQEGMRATLRKIKERFSSRQLQNSPQAVPVDLLNLPAMPQFDDIVKADYFNLPYIKPNKIKKEKLNIAWVTQPIGPGGGGHTTISRFVNYLQEQGHHVSFYLYHVNTINQSTQEARDIFKRSYGIDVEVHEIEAFANQDLVFATSWDTAYAVFNLPNENLHKLYFVQDFEPVFYGLGSRYKLAEATYKFGFYGVTAGPWLAQKVSEYGMVADYFNFGADVEIYRPKASIHKKKKICFYARAHTERRGFEIGIMALKIFKEKHPEYEIEFFGQDMSNYDIPFEFVDRGILNKEELATIYQESVACLVLSLTNVSLLPLELLVAGCIPVMNDGENNRLVLGETEEILYADAYPVDLAQKLCDAVEYEAIDRRAEAVSQKYQGVSWEESYKKLEEIIKREVIDG
ncbi:glycosyltransferase family 4 protein [Streptococcus acidominimus]|uniref:Glycosyltransferase family 1 protein n=1 Tax=Streptococcus acidominimus TaxID=1326 RepID=A0A4Y9FPF8_STRAI|nr:glycosyltransferase family 4 protein [Streptococcus acidominimus]MBF0818572.1 glycosyltransferase family 4 protein [Streptococcus acidominimus]MBF0838222.1 glycosyltransferase family 4 protein [Streptococcus acidominimus]MBF0848002.1 glycosyltransferase family 4 protein [Streptococcus danieliae]TFU31097.1 glycosyltransferase family 1 protein [Streptococcus acidominimus]